MKQLLPILSALLLVACGSETSSNPVEPSLSVISEGGVQRIHEVFVGYPNDCNGETLYLEADATFIVRNVYVPLADTLPGDTVAIRPIHMTNNYNIRLTGYSLESGSPYHGNVAGQSEAAFPPGATVWTGTYRVQLIGAGPAQDMSVRFINRFTIAPDGSVVGSRYEYAFDCH